MCSISNNMAAMSVVALEHTDILDWTFRRHLKTVIDSTIYWKNNKT